MAALAAVAIGAQVVSSVVGAAGQRKAGKQAAEAAKAEAKAIEAEQKAREEVARLQREVLEFEAGQLEKEGKLRQAVAFVQAKEVSRNRQLAESKLQANAAAGGFSATDPTALAVADEIVKYGIQQERLTRFGGTADRSILESQAEGKRKTGAAIVKGAEATRAASAARAEAARKGGKAARTSANYGAASTILGGVSSIAGKYGGTISSAVSGSNFNFG